MAEKGPEWTSAILLVRGSSKGKGRFVGDGEYYFKEGALHRLRALD